MEALFCAEVYFVCLLFTGLLLLWAGRSGTRSTAELWFKRMLLSFLISFFSLFLFAAFNRAPVFSHAAPSLSYALITLFFFALAMGVFHWCGYAEAVLGGGLFENKRSRRLLYIPLVFALALPILNLFTHWMFFFDAAGAFRRYVLFQGELAVLFLLSLPWSYRLLRQALQEGDPTQRSHLLLTALFPLCLLAAPVFFRTGLDLPVLCVCITLALQCIFLSITQHQISVDPLTQLNNRQNLIGFIRYKIKNHTDSLYLLMLDLDDFKSINDTYGHLEGDRALRQLAGVLKQVCGPYPKRPYIARYGGDEFIILLEGSADGVQSLCDGIHTALQKISDSSPSYRLRVTIGCAPWQPGMDQKALIAAADADLYRKKNQSSSRRR